MKSVMGVLLLAVLSAGCVKRLDAFSFKEDAIVQKDGRVLPRLRFVREQEWCVDSYDALVTLLGAATVPVHAVELSDGTLLTTGSGILSMEYRAVPKTESHSVFRSQFTLHHDFHGYLQVHFSDVWSLGCRNIGAGTPPFTNIKTPGQVLLINSSLYMGAGPHAGKQIKYLLVQ